MYVYLLFLYRITLNLDYKTFNIINIFFWNHFPWIIKILQIDFEKLVILKEYN